MLGEYQPGCTVLCVPEARQPRCDGSCQDSVAMVIYLCVVYCWPAALYITCANEKKVREKSRVSSSGWRRNWQVLS